MGCSPCFRADDTDASVSPPSDSDPDVISPPLTRATTGVAAMRCGAAAGVGAAAGFLGGIAGIPGPPPVLYWMASPEPQGVIRANLMALFLLLEIATLANVVMSGMVNGERLMLGIAGAPVYLAGILAGRALFPLASPATYRRLAFAVILFAVITALPLWNG